MVKKKYLKVRFTNPNTKDRTYINARWDVETRGMLSFIKVTYRDFDGKFVTDYLNPNEVSALRMFEMDVEEESEEEAEESDAQEETE